MITRTFSDEPSERAAWDDFVASAAQGGVLQSSAWGEFKRQAGWRPLRLAIETNGRLRAGAQVLLRTLPLGVGSLAYCPRGPVGEWQDPEAGGALWTALHRELRRRRAIFLKIEPNAPPSDALHQMLNVAGFRRAAGHIQPVATLHVDLNQDMAAIAAAQKSKTRYNIGLSARKGVSIDEGGVADLPAVYPLLRETSQRDGFPIHTPDYYEALLRGMAGEARLTIARHEGDVLAAVFLAAFGREAIYLHGASGTLKRNLMPTYLIQWEAMQWAKARGCQFYDLWGIPEEVTDDDSEPEAQEGGLWGVYRFKRGFGGRLVRYAGGYDYVYSPLRYRLWTELLPRYRTLLLRRLGMRNER
jgi:lipid II:glycine glycyltransferase (peptidoglycan interpeptide bridge formation enzyme)